MNITKVQTEFLKRLIKGDKILFCDGASCAEGAVGISDDHAIYFIPEDDMHLSRKGGGLLSDVTLKSLSKYYEQTTLAILNGETKKTLDGEAVKLVNEDGAFVWVLKKYLFCFDKYDSYYIAAPNKPVYVTDEDMQLQAIILPYKIK